MEQRERGIKRMQIEGQSPLTTYSLREMDRDAIERYGLSKYLRREVKPDEQGS